MHIRFCSIFVLKQKKRQRENLLSLNKVLFVNPLKCIFAFRIFTSITTSSEKRNARAPQGWRLYVANAVVLCNTSTGRLHITGVALRAKASRHLTRRPQIYPATTRATYCTDVHAHDKPHVRTCLICLINFCFVRLMIKCNEE